MKYTRSDRICQKPLPLRLIQTCFKMCTLYIYGERRRVGRHGHELNQKRPPPHRSDFPVYSAVVVGSVLDSAKSYGQSTRRWEEGGKDALVIRPLIFHFFLFFPRERCTRLCPEILYYTSTHTTRILYYI